MRATSDRSRECVRCSAPLSSDRDSEERRVMLLKRSFLSFLVLQTLLATICVRTLLALDAEYAELSRMSKDVSPCRWSISERGVSVLQSDILAVQSNLSLCVDFEWSTTINSTLVGFFKCIIVVTHP